MKKIISLNNIFIAISLSLVAACGSTKETSKEDVQTENENQYLIETSFGDMVIELYDETPLHRDNFKKLVADSFYNGTLFHRCISSFMIQGGDPTSINAKPGQQLGAGNIEYTIPAEFNEKFIHKKGALAAARQGDQVNPAKASSGCQFYIVQGSKVGGDQLKSLLKRKEAMAKRAIGPKVVNDPKNAKLKADFFRVRSNGPKDSIEYYGNQIQLLIDELYQGNDFEYSPEQIALYDSIGGTPALDMDYTVFGEVVKGLDIIDSIASQKTDKANRPLSDVKMTIKKL